jgi:hypothetical protein
VVFGKVNGNFAMRKGAEGELAEPANPARELTN